MKRNIWSSRLGFFLAAVGSAAGLGNLWRFPYVVGENGGGAFVLIYIFFALTIGLALLIGELILGKSTGQSVLLATAKTKFKWIGRSAVILSVLVLSYYCVISGWALHFSTLFLSQLFKDAPVFSGAMDSLMNNGLLQAGLASVHILFSVIIVIKGIEDGIEKWTSWMIPVFALLMIILVIKSMSLETSTEAFRFLFYPDFSKLKLSSLSEAIGHVSFTLSIGFGTMVTFGSYLQDQENIPSAGVRIAFTDTMISLFAGLLVFPIALGASSDIPLTDPGLLFEILPPFISNLPGGILFGFAFFVCLYIAALNASIGLLENVVSNFSDRTRMSRPYSGVIVGCIIFLLSLIPAFSGSLFKNYELFGKGLLEILDSLVINWVFPLVIMGMSLAISGLISDSDKEKYFMSKDSVDSVTLFPYWKYLLKWVIPSVVIVALIMRIFGLFSN